MGNNIIRAILNIVEYGEYDLGKYATTSRIRINAVGDQLEYYVKDAIASSFYLAPEGKNAAYQRVLSYTGTQNHPPDFMIRGGDAFEIKKLESFAGSIQLNSSPPRAKLRADDPMITAECKNCESPSWAEKDLFYAIGAVIGSKLECLTFVQGACYAAENNYYGKILRELKNNVDSALDSLNLEKDSSTKELGRVNNADPLGISLLRVRGVWIIKNPLKVFEEELRYSENKFNLFAIIEKGKYDSFPKEDTAELEINKNIIKREIKIKDPNTSGKTMDAILISFTSK